MNAIVNGVAGKAQAFLRQWRGNFDNIAEKIAVDMVQNLADKIQSNLIVEVQKRQLSEKKLRSAFKEKLISILKKTVPPVKGTIYSNYSAQRDAAVGIFARQYIKALQFGPLDKELQKMSINYIMQESNLTPLKDFVKDNYKLTVDQTKAKARDITGFAKDAARNTIGKTRGAHFEAKETHHGKWTKIITELKTQTGRRTIKS